MLARAAIRASLARWCAEHLAVGSTIACYEPLGTEPGSIELLAELTRSGYRVLVPITLADNDLDWSVWTLTPQHRVPLGLSAIEEASLVIVPAFAVDHAGHRLGRGGGSYDRALPRIRPNTTVAALLFADEVLDHVPTQAWDQLITAAVTPEGWLDLDTGAGPGPDGDDRNR